VATSSENAIGRVTNLVEVASDEPLSVDGTVFVSVPPEGFSEDEGGVPDGEFVGEDAVEFQNIEQRINDE